VPGSWRRVKANGCGHGACTVAQATVAAGAEWLGTTHVAEASEPRTTGRTLQIPHSTVQDGPESAAVLLLVRQPSEPGKEPKHQPMGGPFDGYDGRAQESSGGAYAWVLDHSGRSLQDR
jgi:Alanine racemase, N-terminal domain